MEKMWKGPLRFYVFDNKTSPFSWNLIVCWYKSLRGIGLRELVEILVVLTVWFEGIEEGDFKSFKKAQFWSLQNGGIRDGIHSKHNRKEV